MKAPFDKLYKLIKNLESQEKRFLSIELKKNKENSIQFELYNSLASLKNYDETLLIKKLSSIGITKKNIIHHKRDLFDKIVHDMVLFHKSTSMEDELNEKLMEVKFLINKQFYTDAHKKIEDIKSKSIKNDLYLITFNVLIVELKLLRHLNKKDLIKNTSENNYSLLSSTLAHYSNYLSFEKLFSKTYLLYLNGDYLFSRKAYNEMAKLWLDPVLSENNVLKNEASLFWDYDAKSVMYNIFHDYKNAFYYQEKVVEMIRKRDYISPTTYLLANANLCLFGVRAGYFKKVDAAFNKCKIFYTALPEKSKNHSVKLYYSGILSNVFYLKPHQKKDYRTVVTNAENELHFDFIHQFLGHVHRNHNYLTIATACLFIKRYKESLFWLNKIEITKNNVTHDIATKTQIVSLFTHFELHNFELVESILRSNLKKHTSTDDFRTELFILLNSFFTKLIKNSENKIDSSNLLKDFNTNIITMSKNNFFVNTFLLDFDIISWINNK